MTRTRTKKIPYRHSPRRTRSKMTPPRRGSPVHFKFKWRWLVFVLLMIPVGIYVSLLDVKVREQFEGKRWALPARVYASPLEIYTGMRLSPQSLAQELKVIGYRQADELYQPGQYQLKSNHFFVITRAFKFWDATDPSRMVQISFRGNEISGIYELNPDRQLALVRLEPQLIGKIYPSHHEDRILVRLSETPPLLAKALIAMEDRGFYRHFGLSLRGLARASLENWKAGEWVQGGSTLTQQLIKNFYLSPERTFNRKLNEAMMALLLEWHYDKDQILEAYLNEVYLGQDGDRAIHGMGMAARFYFNRPLEELKLPELALLVSLIRGASHYNPRKHPERAKERRDLVLDLMQQQNVISSAQAETAKAVPLNITEEATESRFPYPAFVELVRRQLRRDYREEDLRSEGLQIFTTLDTALQRTAEQTFTSSLKRLEKGNAQARNLQGAMVVTGSENGEVLAMVNGKNSQYAGFNRPLDAVRQIGSLVKVAVYLTALENNHYTLTSLLDDSPYQWKDEYTGEIWKPQNYDFRSHGRIPLHQALANSYNLATVRLGMQLGLDKVKNTMKRMGIERNFKLYPSVLLGSIALSPLEVTQMYQTIASGGFRIPLRAIREVLNHEGKPLQRYPLSVEQSFDSAPIFLLNYALQQAVRKGTGRRVAKRLASNMVLAGKTGTSNDLRDSWFAGFDSDLLTVTWVGRDDNKPMGLSGGSGAMVIWGDFIRAVRPQSLAPMTPSRVQWRWIRSSGKKMRMPFIVNNNTNVLLDSAWVN